MNVCIMHAFAQGHVLRKHVDHIVFSTLFLSDLVSSLLSFLEWIFGFSVDMTPFRFWISLSMIAFMFFLKLGSELDLLCGCVLEHRVVDVLRIVEEESSGDPSWFVVCAVAEGDHSLLRRYIFIKTGNVCIHTMIPISCF
jgi:hypothetical protein